MSYHDDQLGGGDVLEDLHDLCAGLGIEGSCRLVRQDDIRVVDQGAGDGHTLNLASGHLRRPFVDLVAQTYLLERFDCAASPLIGGYAGEGECELDV